MESKGKKGRKQPSSVAKGFLVLGSLVSSESWDSVASIRQEQRRVFFRRSLRGHGPLSLVTCYFQRFPVDGWLPGDPAGWSGLIICLPNSISACGHDSFFLLQASKLQRQELYLLFHLKPL